MLLRKTRKSLAPKGSPRWYHSEYEWLGQQKVCPQFLREKSKLTNDKNTSKCNERAKKVRKRTFFGCLCHSAVIKFGAARERCVPVHFSRLEPSPTKGLCGRTGGGNGWRASWVQGKRTFVRFRGHRLIGVLRTCYPTHRTDPLVWGNAFDLRAVSGLFFLPWVYFARLRLLYRRAEAAPRMLIAISLPTTASLAPAISFINVSTNTPTICVAGHESA